MYFANQARRPCRLGRRILQVALRVCLEQQLDVLPVCQGGWHRLERWQRVGCGGWARTLALVKLVRRRHTMPGLTLRD